MKIGEIELGEIPIVVGTVSNNINLPIEVAEKVDMFEIRIDMFESHEIAYIVKMIKSLKIVYVKPLIATVRSKDEGGIAQIDDIKRYEIFKAVIPLVEAIDIELRSTDLIKKVLPLCKKENKLLIVSYHNYNKTPEEATMEKLVLDGKGMGADIVKIAAKANTRKDLSSLISFTIKNRDKGIITISQGSIGTISRIINPILGSLMTYGYVDMPSAEGQMSVFDLIEHLRFFHPEYNERLIERVQLMEAV